MGATFNNRPPNVISKGSPVYVNYTTYTWTGADVVAGLKDVTISIDSTSYALGYTAGTWTVGASMFRPFTDFTSLTSQISAANTWHIDDPAAQLNANDVVIIVYGMTV